MTGGPDPAARHPATGSAGTAGPHPATGSPIPQVEAS